MFVNIVFIGFKKCGKTTIGAKVAERLHRPFVDIDQLISKLYSDELLSPAEIYQREGRERFRQMEKKAVYTLGQVEGAVIASGGGTVLTDECVRILKRRGFFVYLKISLKGLKERTITGEALPVFLDPDLPELALEGVYKTREGIYASLSDLTVSVDDVDQETLVDQLVHAITHDIYA